MSKASVDPAVLAASRRHVIARALDVGAFPVLGAAAAMFGVHAVVGQGFSLLDAMAVPGTALCAAYLAFPDFRRWAIGEKGPVRPPAVFEAAGRCMVQARREGGDGVWMVSERDSGNVTFMTPRAFEAYRSAMPEGSTLAVVEESREAFHVRRYVSGRLQSGDEAAYRVFDLGGEVVRAVDYEDGAYVGERDLDGPAPPAP